MKPSTVNTTSDFSAIVCFPERRSFFDDILCMPRKMPGPTHHVPRLLFLAQQGVKVIDWPAQNPDMSPIEHVWDQIEVWICGMGGTSSTVQELWRAVLQAWAAVRPRRVRTLLESMPRCACPFRRQRGSHKVLVVW